MKSFANKTALITGASSGIGKAIALGLARQGARVCLVGRDRENLDAVAHSALAHTAHALTYQVDLTLDEKIHELATRLRRDCEHIDVLVHSAAVISIGRIEGALVEELDRQYRTNLRAPYILTQTLLPMLRACRGQVVFMNSSAGLISKAAASQYAATKHALRALADSLRDEVNADGIRVLSVFLGRTATPMQMAVHEAEGKSYLPENLIQPDAVASLVLNALSLPQSAEVTDIFVRPMKKLK